MLNFAPPPIWEPAVVDTFVRTSSRTLQGYHEKIREELLLSASQSEYLTMLSKFDELTRTLETLRSMQEDWNGYGSPAPTTGSIQEARQVLDLLRLEGILPRRVLASAEGGVAFIFFSSTENRAVIESLNNGERFVLLYDRKGNSKTLDFSGSSSAQEDRLRQLRDHLRGASLAASRE